MSLFRLPNILTKGELTGSVAWILPGTTGVTFIAYGPWHRGWRPVL